MHRFVAQLKLPQFKINKVDIWENPVSADIILSEASGDEASNQGIAYLFKRKRNKTGAQFKIRLSVNKLDALGRNFFIDYNFAVRLQPEGLDEKIHLMMEAALGDNPSFLTSRISHIEA